MKKQILILSLLNLFIIKAQVRETDLTSFYHKYENFKQFDDLVAVVTFLDDAKIVYSQTESEELLDFLFNLLKKSNHSIENSAAFFAYMSTFEKALLRSKLHEYGKQLYSNTANCDYQLIESSLLQYAKLQSDSKCSLGYIFKHVLAMATFNNFLLTYTNLESINSETKFNEFRERAFLLNDLDYLLTIDEINQTIQIIDNLVQEASKSPNCFYKSFRLENMRRFFPFGNS